MNPVVDKRMCLQEMHRMFKCLLDWYRRVHFLGVMRRRCAGVAAVVVQAMSKASARYVITYDVCMNIITNSSFTFAVSG